METMATNTMAPANAHTDIPGNPSTATSSAVRLREQADPASLKVLSAEELADVNDGGEIFKSLEFTGSPDDDDLFGMVDVDEEKDESGS